MALFSLTDEWSLEIDENFERHVEDGSLVFSHDDDDRHVWIDIFEDDNDLATKMKNITEDVPENSQIWEFEHDGVTKFGYLVHDAENENYELLAFSIVPAGYALMVFYFDDEESLDWARKCWRSVRYTEVN